MLVCDLGIQNTPGLSNLTDRKAWKVTELPAARPVTLSESGRRSPAGADRVLMSGLRCRCRTDDRKEWGHHPWDGRPARNQTCTVCLHACGFQRVSRTTTTIAYYRVCSGYVWYEGCMVAVGVSVFYRILAARVSRTTRPRNSQWTKPPTAHGHGRGDADQSPSSSHPVWEADQNARRPPW